MKWPWVSRTNYEYELNLRIRAEKALEEYQENENKEVVDWAIQLQDYEELLVVQATHIFQHCFADIKTITAYNGNEVVGLFENVAFYVRYLDYELEDNHLTRLENYEE